jgi:hypothetical protein
LCRFRRVAVAIWRYKSVFNGDEVLYSVSYVLEDVQQFVYDLREGTITSAVLLWTRNSGISPEGEEFLK